MRPTIRLGPPLVAGEPLPEVLELSCSDCGDLDDWRGASAAERAHLGSQARAHRDAVHGGDAQPEGWTG